MLLTIPRWGNGDHLCDTDDHNWSGARHTTETIGDRRRIAVEANRKVSHCQEVRSRNMHDNENADCGTTSVAPSKTLQVQDPDASVIKAAESLICLFSVASPQTQLVTRLEKQFLQGPPGYTTSAGRNNHRPTELSRARP